MIVAMATAAPNHELRKELGLGDLVLAQVLCVVGSQWVGIAAKLGRAHVAFWLAAMLLFYLPLAVVVIYLNRLMPLEGGLYQWAKTGFGEMAGFLTAWNLWVYAVIIVGAIVFVVPTDISYMIGPSAAWLASSNPATLLITGVVMVGITLVAIHGLDIGKWLHNAGSVMVMLAYAVLLPLPLWALWRGAVHHYEPVPWELPKLDWFSVAVFGQMTAGALSGFEYVAILAGECRSAARNIGQSVVLSAPVICLMFILGTSSVLTFIGHQPINVIGPIPQTFRLAFGPNSWVAPFAIFLLIGAGGRLGEPDFHGADAAADGGGVGQPGAAVVLALASAAPHAGELHPVRRGGSDGADPAEHARGARAGGQPVAGEHVDRALRFGLYRIVPAAAGWGFAQTCAALAASGRGGGAGFERGHIGDCGVSDCGCGEPAGLCHQSLRSGSSGERGRGFDLSGEIKHCASRIHRRDAETRRKAL